MIGEANPNVDQAQAVLDDALDAYVDALAILIREKARGNVGSATEMAGELLEAARRQSALAPEAMAQLFMTALSRLVNAGPHVAYSERRKAVVAEGVEQ